MKMTEAKKTAETFLKEGKEFCKGCYWKTSKQCKVTKKQIAKCKEFATETVKGK